MTKAWKRLMPWLPGGEAPSDGEAALRALADVAEVRRQLDQAELAAVRAARRADRSWTEIATMLAITRQSAWERWRDLDEPASSSPSPGEGSRPGDEPAGPVARAAAALARTPRRRRTVAVPDLVGLTSAEALAMLTALGLEATAATPELPLLDVSDDLRPVVVVRQYPDPDTRVLSATTVKLWLERGDGEAGVREPRRPSPPPRAARARIDEVTEQAVG